MRKEGGKATEEGCVAGNHACYLEKAQGLLLGFSQLERLSIFSSTYWPSAFLLLEYFMAVCTGTSSDGQGQSWSEPSLRLLTRFRSIACGQAGCRGEQPAHRGLMVFEGSRQNPVKHTHDKLCWCYEGHKSCSGQAFLGISFIDGGLRGFLWMQGCTLRAPREDISHTGRGCCCRCRNYCLRASFLGDGH